MQAEQPSSNSSLTSSADHRASDARLRAALIAATLVLLPTCILAGAWRLGGVSALEDDLLYYLPMRQYIGERIAAGEMPFWNPLVGMGTSIAADPQSGLWYPPTYLFVILPPLVAYPVTLIAHFALAGWGLYRFCRASGRGWQAAFLGAVAFELCGFLVAHRVHLTMHHAVAWIPWMLYGWRRFADTGRGRLFSLAAAAFGLQMLVQHTQISIMSVMIVTAYAAVVLWPDRRSLLWQFPLGMTLGAAIGAVQTLPTLLHLSATGRGVPTFAMFVENSWVPTSGLMLLFPMLFGNRTPGIWEHEWWGLSHFSEQYAYGCVAVLLLALASWPLVRRSRAPSQRSPDARRLRREVCFWWAASLAALLVALGEFLPLSRVLFHVPIYRNLRVPARWILVWSLAMPILATIALDVIQRRQAMAEEVAATLRRLGTRILPGAAAASLVLLALLRWQLERLESAFAHYWGMAAVLAGARSAITPVNPAIVWPLVVMLVSVLLLLRWSRLRTGRWFAGLMLLVVVDLASVAAFVDVDTRTYDRSDLASSPLAKAIRAAKPDAGHRLLVPRYQADYERPLELLWPQTNMLHGVPTFNAYGPFWPKANRLLFRFMPWGASESMLELLRNQPLCAAMGIRFLAARTDEERELVRAASARAIDAPFTHLSVDETWTPVLPGDDLLWPVRLDEPGIYELRFEAVAGEEPAGQCFVRLETSPSHSIGFARRLEPIDLSEGQRRFRFQFVCPEAVEAAVFVRIKSVLGHAISVRSGSFGRIAAWPPSASTRPNDGGGWVLRGATDDGVSLFESSQAVPLVRLAESAKPVADLRTAVELLTAEKPSVALPGGVIFESNAGPDDLPQEFASDGEVVFERPRADELQITATCRSPGMVVFNESFDPGWTAEVNGSPATVLRVNAVVQGVIVPSGTSRIRFRYRPPGLREGLGVSVAGWIGVLAGGLAFGGRPRNSP